jgi:uncharacterized membrane protein YfcA
LRAIEGSKQMSIFLPVAGRCISLTFLVSLGAAIGLVSGLFGVGGGFLLTPVLMMLGIPATVATASGSCQIVATSSSGVAAHFRLGNVDVKMGSLLLLGGLAGAGFGVEAIKELRIIGEANLAITLTYIVVLGSLGSYMFFQSLRTLRRGAVVTQTESTAKWSLALSRLPWQLDFPRSRVRHSILIPLVLAVLLGILATIMGVGGGFIMLPMMVYLLGMPAHVAVGTSLFQILFSSAGITYMQAATNHTVDLLLVLPPAASSAVGAQVGARLSRLLRGEQLMILLAVLVLFVTAGMASRLFLKPSALLRRSDNYLGRNIARSAPTCVHSEPALAWASTGQLSGRRDRAFEETPCRAKVDGSHSLVATQVRLIPASRGSRVSAEPRRRTHQGHPGVVGEGGT